LAGSAFDPAIEFQKVLIQNHARVQERYQSMGQNFIHLDMSNPTTSWIKFKDRSPTQEELNSDRVVGYFRIEDHSGVVTTDHFGKLFWVDEEHT
tara:strand:- start:676 stop:957 length:282 start_codon:yes stop_codon:yes gene_type:complete